MIHVYPDTSPIDVPKMPVTLVGSKTIPAALFLLGTVCRGDAEP